MHTHITLSTPVERTPRVRQVEGMFNLVPAQRSFLEWEVSLPIEDRPWHVGLIVGPSGSGKSTIARVAFGASLHALAQLPDWSVDRSILDAFPANMPIKEVVALLSSVGFSSPPAWLRPFHVLSTGEQFRVTLARLLACAGRDGFPDIAVLDEYTSVVDRTVARVGSAAVARAIRQRGLKFVAVTCHEDVEDWLQPDWTYRPATNDFQWRLLQPRPTIRLEIARVHGPAWQLFHRHHYLSSTLSPSAVCFAAWWQGRPVAFSAWVNALSSRSGKREHRTVTLPDYQGVGIGHALSTFCASLWRTFGLRATSTTTHPAFIAARRKSPLWRMIRPPSLGRRDGRNRSKLQHATTRLTAGFEYVGPPLDRVIATRIIE